MIQLHLFHNSIRISDYYSIYSIFNQKRISLSVFYDGLMLVVICFHRISFCSFLISSTLFFFCIKSLNVLGFSLSPYFGLCFTKVFELNSCLADMELFRVGWLIASIRLSWIILAEFFRFRFRSASYLAYFSLLF